MTKNTSVILGDHFDKFIQSELKKGRYASASEVIRSGLRMLEDQRKEMQALERELSKGEQSGEPVVFDNEAFKQKMTEKYAK